MRHLSQRLCVLVALTPVAALAQASSQAGSIVEANTHLLYAGDTVTVSRIPDGIYLRSTNDPDDIIWERLPEYRVEVMPAPAVHESVDLRVNYDADPDNVYLNIARTSDRFYVRMRWRDDTRDTETQFERFRDAAAVQFSLGDDRTSYLMGTGPQEPVNIWYWHAGSDAVQNLAAGGYGSTTILDSQSVSGASVYHENDGDPNEWTVVMSRPIPVSGDYETSFRRQSVPMAFAIWQGSEQQRDGLKSVSDGWVLLDMGDE